jgi:FkbM family methyltransferase
MYLLLAKLYARLIITVNKLFGVSPPGLGFLCRKIKLEHTINVEGRKYYFYRGAASMYSTLIAGKFPEPQTHRFFRKIIPKITGRIGFIDVGAAVGEMVIDVAGYDNVDHVIAFDPDPELAKAIRLSASINEYDNIKVIPKVVADEVKTVNFRFNRYRGTSGKICKEEDKATEKTICTTLDNEIEKNDIPYIVLIDVEGAELLVLKGSRKFIQQKRPLIIFEYISGKDNNLPEIRDTLGEGYEIYRMRDDGTLDLNFDKTWNCVAVCKNSAFYPVCQSIIQR